MIFADNPFYILKANPEDSKSKLLLLADEAAFDIDSTKANNSRSILSNPRKRLEAEISWFPGNTEKVNKELLELLVKRRNIKGLKNKWKLNTISFTNLIANLISEKNKELENFYLIRLLIENSSKLDLLEIQSLINKDRNRSGFPEIEYLKDIEEEIDKRIKFYLSCINKITTKLDIDNYCSFLLTIMEERGKKNEPTLLSNIINNFELQFKQLVLKEEERILLKIDQIQTSLKFKYQIDEISKLVYQLIKEFREWNKLVKPIQLSTYKRGLEHKQSKRVGLKIRNLVLELNNNYGETEMARLLSLNLEDVFKEVNSISELSKRDTEILNANYKTKLIEKVAKCINEIQSRSIINREQYFAYTKELIEFCSPILLIIKHENDDDLFLEASDLIAKGLNGLAICHGKNNKGYQEALPILKKALSYKPKANTKEIINYNINIYKQKLKERYNRPLSKSESFSFFIIYIIIVFLTLPLWINFWPAILVFIITLRLLNKVLKLLSN